MGINARGLYSTATDAEDPAYVKGYWYMMHEGVVAAGVVASANILRLMPFRIRQMVNIATIGARITTLAASGNVQFGVYAANGNTLLPTGQPLIQTPSLSTGTAGLLFSAPINGNVQLPRGIYWFGQNVDATAGGVVIFTSLSVAATSMGNLVGAASQSVLSGGAATTIFLRFANVTFPAWPDLTSPTATSEGASNACGVGMFQVAT